MKKYMMLAVGTVLAVALIWGIRSAVVPQPMTVTLVEVTASSVRQTVECGGKVETTDSREVFVKVPCVAKEVYVSEGQRVSQGDVLFSVDTEATRQVLAQLGATVSGGSADDLSGTVTAPISGHVTSLQVREGEVADSTKPCAVIRSGGGVCIAVTVKEKDLSRVAVGQAVEVTGVAFEKEVYRGTISTIAESAHQEYSGTVSETVVDAVVTLEEADESLRTGLNARATVVTAVEENALLVPYDCVGQTEEGEGYVYVYEDGGVARRQFPVLGKECREGVLVVSGLSSGVRLVQDPERLSADCVAVRAG